MLWDRNLQCVNCPLNDKQLVSHFLASVSVLSENTLQNLSDSDMVGINIQNRVNEISKTIGISFRRKNQLEGEVIWSVFERVSQSTSRFNALKKFNVTVHSVSMTVGLDCARADRSQSWNTPGELSQR